MNFWVVGGEADCSEQAGDGGAVGESLKGESFIEEIRGEMD